MAFPIKKRINTEPFSDIKKGLYIQKADKEIDRENILIEKQIRKYLTSWRMVKLKRRESNCRIENTATCLE